MIDRVSALISQVIEEEVLPRFRSLRAEDIVRKSSLGDPEDVVTVVDTRVEARLTTELGALICGSVVVGEEAVHERPALLDALSGAAPVWIIDPIDGTKNFVRGEPGFGVMVALVERQTIRAAWIALPASGQLFVAERGSGAFVDGARLRTLPTADSPRGTIYTRFMPAPLAADVERCIGSIHSVAGAGSAAIEYTAVAQGAKDFAIYYRLEPWDHAAGALLIAEAGGCMLHLDGTSYLPTSPWQATVLAASPALAETLRARLRHCSAR